MDIRRPPLLGPGAGVNQKIELRLGDAAKTLPQFHPPAPLDFVFIDANKDGYDFYYESLLPHVRQGGVIVFDNMLRHGEVLLPAGQQTLETQTINRLNQKLAKDPRVQSVLIPRRRRPESLAANYKPVGGGDTGPVWDVIHGPEIEFRPHFCVTKASNYRINYDGVVQWRIYQGRPLS